jgi:hypothetical protein
VSVDVPDDRAVVDRIDDGIAVLLVGPAGDQHELDADRLPDGVGDGDVVAVTIDGDDIVVGEVDRALTDARRAKAEQRLARIRKERSRGRFG